MSRLNRLSAAGALVILTTLASAAPLPQKTRPPISATNAAQVRLVEELEKAVYKIVRGPGRGELAFVFWEQPVEIVAEADFRRLRMIPDRQRLIHFAASKDGRQIAWSENDTRVVVQEVASGKTFAIETNNSQPSTAFSPDGKLLATGGYGTQAKLWDAATGQAIRALDAGGEGGLWPVFSPDGKILALGNRNDQTLLYEVASGKLLHTLPRKMTQELAFNPEGNVLAVAYVDGSVALWEVASGEMLRAEASGATEVFTLDWSPKGDVLVTAGLGGKIVLWDPHKLKPLKKLEAPGWVINVRFTPDGTRLLTTGGSENTGKRDRKVVIWAVADSAEK